MKVTVYELLGLVKDGKAPKEIKYNGIFYNYEDYDYFASYYGYLFDRYNVSEILNDEVEILEEEKKIPEKLDVLVEVMSSDKIGALTNEIGEIQRRFNQLIDYLKSKGDE